jgi:phosphopantetheinyl transferase
MKRRTIHLPGAELYLVSAGNNSTEIYEKLMRNYPEHPSAKYRSYHHRLQQLLKQELIDKLQLNEVLHYTSDGKPYLTDGRYISLSHSRNAVALALSNRKNIGVDIQYKTGKAQAIATKFVHSSDGFFLSSNETYTILWTVKEAVCKSLGCKGIILRKIFLVDLQYRQGIASYNNRLFRIRTGKFYNYYWATAIPV